MDVNFSLNIDNVIEVTKKDTNEKAYYILQNDEWVLIDKDEYNKILRGN